MDSQLASTNITETTHVAASSMFATSPETHLYGGSSLPLGYQSLSSTFSGVASSPWTCPMSSSFGILYGTSLMNTTQSTLSPPSQPTIEQ